MLPTYADTVIQTISIVQSISGKYCNCAIAMMCGVNDKCNEKNNKTLEIVFANNKIM